MTTGGGQDRRVAPLLDLDPDLGQALDATRADEARRRLAVRVRRIPSGPWDTHSIRVADPGHMGLLLLDGLVAREVVAADIVSTELLGPGDLLRPWALAPDPDVLDTTVRWNVLADARVAVLDRRVAAELGRFPEVLSLFVERLSRRSSRLAMTQAISKLNKVDQRLLTLFWHLAERWGRITPDGVVIPLTLSHRMLSQLVGARRPTVSTALGELARTGTVQRTDSGTWLLTGRPVGAPAGEPRLVPPRRRFVAAEGEPRVDVPAADLDTGAVHGRVPRPDLLERLERLRADCRRTTADLRSAAVTTNELARRNRQLREQTRPPQGEPWKRSA